MVRYKNIPMKKFIYSLALIVLVIAFSSCGNNEEIYNPKTCKLYKIWDKSEVGDPTETFSYEKNLLKTIDFFDESDSVHYMFDFQYNKDKTVSEISHETANYTEAIKIFYSDKLVCRMLYTMDDSLRMELLFQRDPETQKLVKIVEYYDMDYYHNFEAVNKSVFFDYFIGFNDVAEEYFLQNKGALSLHCNRDITYTEENITKVVETYPEYNQVVTSNYTYIEESYNPYYGLNYAYKGLRGYSLYNVLSSDVTTTVNGSVTKQIFTDYEYVLNDKLYPRRQIVRERPDADYPVNTYFLYLSE